MPKTALITGASSGLGAEFARQVAGLGVNVVLVARSGEELRARADGREPIASQEEIRIEILLPDNLPSTQGGRAG